MGGRTICVWSHHLGTVGEEGACRGLGDPHPGALGVGVEMGELKMEGVRKREWEKKGVEEGRPEGWRGEGVPPLSAWQSPQTLLPGDLPPPAPHCTALLRTPTSSREGPTTSTVMLLLLLPSSPSSTWLNDQTPFCFMPISFFFFVVTDAPTDPVKCGVLPLHLPPGSPPLLHRLVAWQEHSHVMEERRQVSLGSAQVGSGWVRSGKLIQFGSDRY